MSPTAKYAPDGVLLLSPMIGPWDRYEAGSPEWAEAIAMHLQINYQRLQRDGTTDSLVRVLKEAVNNTPHPWEVFPAEAKGDPERWMRLVTGRSWSEIEAIVSRHDPDAWRTIATSQAQWEAEHRTHGGDRSKPSVTGVDRDDESARGIRRRLQKRANDGDAEAAELVSQLAAGDITVNQAAIAAGMRQRYVRVRADDPEKAAASIVARMGAEWAAQLAQALHAI